MTIPLLRLRILHSNDIHSHFEQMPKIAGAFEELRNAVGEEHTLTLDIGDHLDRVRPETEGSAGEANLDIMAATGYDAITLGNNEGLTFTPDTLTKLYGAATKFKVLCSNLLENKTGTYPDWGVPYYIVEKGGIKVGMIGVTAYFPEFYRLIGWDIQEPLGVIAELVQQLRPKVDVIVVLSHLGLKQDERMAAEISGIDLILGGHTHHLLEQPLRIGDAVVCAAGKFGQYIGVVDLAVDPQTRRVVEISGYVKELMNQSEVTSEAIKLDSKSPSAVVEARMELQIKNHTIRAEKVLDRQVAYLEHSLDAQWYEETPLGNMLAAALRKWTESEIGLVNAGQFLGALEQGSVTAGRLLDICPSPINPCHMMLTGEQILQALEESLLPEFMEKRLYGFGFRGKVLGMLNVDGLTIEYNVNAPPYSKIQQAWVGSNRLNPHQEYKVGTIDMFTFGIGYLTLSQGTRIAYFLPEFIRDLMRQELNDPESIRESGRSRWIMYGE